MTATIAQLLDERVQRDPNAVFYVARDGEVTVGELADEVATRARQLRSLGLERGDCAVVWLPNGLLWIALLLACARIGVTLVTAGPRLRLTDLPYMLEQSGARSLFYRPEFLGVDYDSMVGELIATRASGSLPRLDHVLRCAAGVGPNGTQPIDAVPQEGELPPPPPPDAAAVVCFTGGSTGRPRGCVHDHGTLVRNARIAGRADGLRAGRATRLSHAFRARVRLPHEHPSAAPCGRERDRGRALRRRRGARSDRAA